MKLKHRLILFLLGSSGYVLLELLWRGRSHISMFFAGGICFLLIGHLTELPHPAPRRVQVIVGAGIITMVELLFGLLVNRSWAVWDYRGIPLSFLGQICLPYTLLWLPVSWLALGAYDFSRRRLHMSREDS